MTTIMVMGAKGGQGATTMAAAIALMHSMQREETLIVDPWGDVPTVLGVPDTMREAPVMQEIGAHLHLAPILQSGFTGTVVQDYGTVEPTPLAFGDRTVLIVVASPCYLAMRRLTKLKVKPDVIALAQMPERALGQADCEAVTGVTCVEFPWVPTIGRMVDAGLFMGGKLPHDYLRSVGRIVGRAFENYREART